MNTIEKLNLIGDLQDEIELAILRKAEKLAALEKQIPAEILDAMRRAENDAAETLERCEREAAELRAEVKAEVLAAGKSVKGAHIEARFVKGRVSWDGKALDAMIAFVPQIATARSEGQSSVSFYEVKK